MRVSCYGTWHGLFFCHLLICLIVTVGPSKPGTEVVDGELFNEGGAIPLEVPPLKYLQQSHVSSVTLLTNQDWKMKTWKTICRLKIVK